MIHAPESAWSRHDASPRQAEGKCPFHHAAGGGATATSDWWPNQLNLACCTSTRPLQPDGRGFDYAEAFQSWTYHALKADLKADDRQPGLVAGRLRPLRPCSSAWPGTRRHLPHADGRGGAGTGKQRFAPLNSWPDNGNLDKAAACCGRSSRSTARSSPGPT
jgi:catalase-peroxidase